MLRLKSGRYYSDDHDMLEQLKRLLKRKFSSMPQIPKASLVAVDFIDVEKQCLTLYGEALKLLDEKRLTEAECLLQEVLAAKHDFAEAHFTLGVIYKRQAKIEESTDSLLMATAFNPDFPQAHFVLGTLSMQQGQFDEALARFQRALELNPDYAEAWNGVGAIMAKAEKYADARSCFEKAITLKQDFAAAYSNLSNVLLKEFYAVEEAMSCVRKALELEPDLAEAHSNLAMILQYQARSREAIAAANNAIRLAPDFANAHLVRAMALLSIGDFSTGWEDYESRKKGFKSFRIRHFPYPEWNGASLEGRTILVYAEQGLGDEIMFSSCFPDLLACGGQVIIDCNSKLEKIFRRSFPRAMVRTSDQTISDLSWLSELPPVHCQIAAGSLPLHFRREQANFPQHAGYLIPDVKRLEYWKARLENLGPGLKIGISWRGGHRYTNQQSRSVELNNLVPIFKQQAAIFISLQYTDCQDELEKVQKLYGIEIRHWQEAIDDYDETAALVSALDLVISVQTAIVHLSGALGKPVWVLVPTTAEWRYLAEGDRMPWYPSARLFRQPCPGDWGTVIERVCAELDRMRPTQ